MNTRKILVGFALGALGAIILISMRPVEDPMVVGKRYLAEEKYEQAISEFTKAIRAGSEQKDPERNPYLFRSIAFRSAGDDNGADTDLAKANEQIGALKLEAWMEEHRGHH